MMPLLVCDRSLCCPKRRYPAVRSQSSISLAETLVSCEEMNPLGQKKIWAEPEDEAII